MILFLCPFVWLSSGRLSTKKPFLYSFVRLSSGRLSTKKLLYIIFVRENLSCSSTKILLAMNFVGIILEKCPLQKDGKAIIQWIKAPKNHRQNSRLWHLSGISRSAPCRKTIKEDTALAYKPARAAPSYFHVTYQETIPLCDWTTALIEISLPI